MSLNSGSFQRNKWGLDFWNNTKVVKTCYGKYSTELFAEHAEKIIAEHDQSKVISSCYFKMTSPIYVNIISSEGLATAEFGQVPTLDDPSA